MSQIKVNSIVPVAGLSGGASGGIIQVKQTLWDDHDNYTNTSFAALSGFTCIITPSSTSSKILVTLNLSVEVRSASIVAIELTRGGSSLFTNEGGMRGDGTAQGGYVSMTYLDSPASTSALTYGVQTRTSNSTYAINNYIGSGPCNSFLTLMEVSG